jgi:hypothetical protein
MQPVARSRVAYKFHESSSFEPDRNAKTPSPQNPADMAPLHVEIENLCRLIMKRERTLRNMVEEVTKHIFTPPTCFIDTALHDVMQAVAPLAQAGPRMEITDEGKEYKIKVGSSISCLREQSLNASGRWCKLFGALCCAPDG